MPVVGNSKLHFEKKSHLEWLKNEWTYFHFKFYYEKFTMWTDRNYIQVKLYTVADVLFCVSIWFACSASDGLIFNAKKSIADFFSQWLNLKKFLVNFMHCFDGKWIFKWRIVSIPHFMWYFFSKTFILKAFLCAFLWNSFAMRCHAIKRIDWYFFFNYLKGLSLSLNIYLHIAERTFNTITMVFHTRCTKYLNNKNWALQQKVIDKCGKIAIFINILSVNVCSSVIWVNF